jgi:hypothetical protein
MGVETAHPDDKEQRQLEVVHEIAKGVASLEKTGALHENNRLLAAETETSGNGNCLSFPANTDQGQSRFSN